MALIQPLPRKYKAHGALFIAGLAGLVAAGVYGQHGALHLMRMRADQAALEHSAFQWQQRNEQLRGHIARLESDDLYLERIARERLGLARPDELIYRDPTVQR